MNAKSETEAKIIARNRLNSQINYLIPIILERIRPFVGQKILTNNGWAAKFKPIIEAYLGAGKVFDRLQIYRSHSNYSLALIFKTSENYSEFTCIYQEEWIHLGDLNGYDLKSVSTFEPLKTDFSLETVLKLREEYQVVDKQRRKIESELSHFGIY